MWLLLWKVSLEAEYEAEMTSGMTGRETFSGNIFCKWNLQILSSLLYILMASTKIVIQSEFAIS